MIRIHFLGPIQLKDELNGELRKVLAQPKRLALLAYLVLANGQYRRRDSILFQFWPELDVTRGRNALRQAIHHLRKELGPDSIVARNGEELGINPEVVWCDVTAFKEALTSGDDAGAVRLYNGDFLAGLHFADAPPEWESWVEGTRNDLRASATAAAWRQADRTNELEWARRAFEISNDEASFREYATRLARTGDLIALRRAYDAFKRRLEREYEITPADETNELIQHLLTTSRFGSPLPELTSSTPRVFRKRSRILIPALLVLGVIASVAWWKSASKLHPQVLAVGTIHDMAQSPTVASALSELMTTELARAGGSRVISSSRLFEVALQLDSAAPTKAFARAAVAAGADEYLEGALYKVGGELRLDLRRVQLRSGRVLSVYTVTGPNAYSLTERATGRVLGDLGLQPASGSLADVTTHSVIALRFFQEGLRAKLQNDERGARRFLSAAVAEDSMFAMAVFELARVQPENPELKHRALRLAEHATDRERLIIKSWFMHETDDPRRLAVAETLAVRYPTEPEGLLWLGRAQTAAAHFAAAAKTFRQLVIADSLSLRGNQNRCRACEGYDELIGALIFVDSLDKALAYSREFAAKAPARPLSWMRIADVLHYQGHFDEAADYVAKYEAMLQQPLGDYPTRTMYLVKQGRFAEAEAYIGRIYEFAQNKNEKENALWTEYLMLRNMGRYRDALKLADGFRSRNPNDPPGKFYWDATPRIVSLYDLRRYAESAALADSARMFALGTTPSRRARSLAGNYTHELSCYAALGDTARVRALRDSVLKYAPQSGYARDQKYAYYARGVYSSLVGRKFEAAQQLNQSIYSPLGGSIRANFELGKSLLAVGKPREAFYYFDAGVRGPWGGSSISVTQPEIRLWRAKAREAMGDQRGAKLDYERVLRDLAKADPEAAPLRNFAAQRVRAL